MSGVNFHQHSDGSFLDGCSSPKDICDRAVELGFDYVCLSDHGNVSRTLDMYDEAKAHNLIPVLGTELYCKDDKYDNDKSKGFHLCVWALNEEGLHNVWAISSNTYYGTGDGHRTPNAKWEHFDGLGKGVACTSACLAGALSVAAKRDDEEMALYFVNKYREIFDEFYIEIHTNSMPEQRSVNLWLIEFAKKQNIKCVYAVDSHYARKEDAEFHDMWLGCQTKSFYDQEHWTMDHEYYMQGEEEIAERLAYLGDDLQMVFDGTYDLLSKVESYEIDSSHKVPKFKLPDGWTDSGAYLKFLVICGLLRKVGGMTVIAKNPEEEVNKGYIGFKGKSKTDLEPYIKQLTEVELPIILEHNLSDYFLIVSDYCKYAKTKMLVGPGRGCLAPDSMVLTVSGAKKIEDITTDDFVFDGDGCICRVSDVHKYECHEELVHIDAFYGDNGVSMTKDHKVMVSRVVYEDNKSKLAKGYRYKRDVAKPEWVRADEINVNDLVVMPKIKFDSDSSGFYIDGHGYSYSFESREFEANYDMGRFIGLIISNGWLKRKSMTEIGIAVNAKEDCGEVPKLLKRLFGENVSYRVGTSNSGANQYILKHNGVRRFIRELFPDYEFSAQSKYIPDSLLAKCNDFRLGLLHGLWEGDGSHKGKTSYTTASKRLAYGVFKLLLSLGLPAGLSIEKRTEKREEWNRGNRPYSIYYKVNSSHNFYEIKRQNGVSFDGEYIYYRVRNKEYVKNDSGYVYDITVPTTSSYCTSSFLVHNSCTASILCYVLDITEIDPLGKGLIFGRFLNEGRMSSLPDIDLDFPKDKKHLIHEYLSDKYGQDHVTAVGLMTFFGIKLALKEVCRYYRIPVPDANRMTSIVGDLEEMAVDGNWESQIYMLDSADQDFLNAYKKSYPELFNRANRMVGLARQGGKHAAGYVISPEPLAKILPVRKSSNDEIISQFDKVAVERMGFLKADILGLRNLETLDLAARLVKERHGVDIDFYSLREDPNDDVVWKLFEDGNTLGIFQLEGAGITNVAKVLKPRSISEISTILALYRPGVIHAKTADGIGMLDEYLMRVTGQKDVEYITPKLEPILKETYGTIVYQEQAMRIFTDLADFTDEEADHIRAAIGKKKIEKIKAEKPKFIEKCAKNGVSKYEAEEIFSQIEASGSYSFNKAHSYGYGTVTFWTAYMKAHYPIEYYAACMSTIEAEKAVLYIREAKRHGIKIVPPVLSGLSDGYTILSDDEIAFGLTNVKQVGQKAIDKILDGMPYSNFDDFVDRSGANSRVIKQLINGGIFREIYPNRRELLARYESGDFRANLFGDSLSENGLSNKVMPYTEENIIDIETEIFGMPISIDPFEDYRNAMGSTYQYVESKGKVENSLDNSSHLMLVRVENVRPHMSKKGQMAFLTMFTDSEEKVDVTCFTKVYELIKDRLKVGNYLVIEVNKSTYNGKISLVLNKALKVEREQK